MTTETIHEINALSAEAFVLSFGDIAEASPWVAETAAAKRPFSDFAALTDAFTAAVDDAPPATQLALLMAHPDLAGRAAIAGELLPESRAEQAGAGLDRLTPEEFARFTELNDRYRAQFEFPFILAVKGATKATILASFEERLGNDVETEFANALAQVKRIIRFRLEDRIAR